MNVDSDEEEVERLLHDVLIQLASEVVIEDDEVDVSALKTIS